jgi:hypothetical protein
MKKTNALFILGSILLLTGCSSEAGQAPASFGQAVNQNIAAQIVNPDAAEKNAVPVFNGERAALAQKNYVNDKTTTAVAPSTTTSSGGGQ